jgi:hypothetical protein
VARIPPLHWGELISPFTVEQLSTVEIFVDELIDLYVLDAAPKGTIMLNTCPFFPVPNPGQL